MTTRLIVGCGYLGTRVARRWQAIGDDVLAVTRSVEHAEQLGRQNLPTILADVTRPESLQGLPPAETVLYAVGFDRTGSGSRRDVYVDGLSNVLDVLTPETGKIIFTSSTGVYHQDDGSWVDEDSPCHPAREAGRMMLAGEQVLAAHPLGDRRIVLRLAGLYGPGRIPRAADVLAGRPITAPSGCRLNLIHVDDAATAVLAAADRAQPPRTYLISDGHPTEHRAFYRRVAELAGVATPEFIDPPPDSEAAIRLPGDKRASNRRMMSELSMELMYPTYQAGLEEIMRDER